MMIWVSHSGGKKGIFFHWFLIFRNLSISMQHWRWSRLCFSLCGPANRENEAVVYFLIKKLLLSSFPFSRDLRSTSVWIPVARQKLIWWVQSTGSTSTSTTEKPILIWRAFSKEIQVFQVCMYIHSRPVFLLHNALLSHCGTCWLTYFCINTKWWSDNRPCLG